MSIQNVNKCPQNFQVPFIKFDDLFGQELNNDTVIFVNRESTDQQKDNHLGKIVELEKAHTRLEISQPFVFYSFEGPGNLIVLHESLKGSNSEMKYFDRLKEKIEAALNNIIPGRKLYIVAVTKDRILRPQNLKRNKESWVYTEEDMQLFNQWLYQCFEDRVKDICFVLLETDNSKQRSVVTKMGMKQKGNKGGKPQHKLQTLDQLIEEAIKLKMEDENRSAGEIRDILKNRIGNVHLPQKRMIQLWLRKAGVHQKRGRRKDGRIQKQ